MRPYLRVANVYEARIDTRDILEMNFEPDEYERYRLDVGDVLLNEGQSKELVGRPAIYRGEIPGACFQNTLVRFRARPFVDPEFALIVFRNYLHDGTFQSIASWTTNIAHLGAGRFAELDFPLPPLKEQRSIVAEIGSYLSRLDAAVEGLKRVQANLKRYRASVLKAAVEGRLVPTEAELARQEGRDYEHASVLLERILKERRKRWEQAELAKFKAAGKTPKDDKWKAKYEEPAAPDTSELPGLPDGWCWATVDQLGQVGTGATPRRGNGRYWENGTVPWITSAAVGTRKIVGASALVTEAALKETNLTLYPSGTIVLAMYGEGKTRGSAAVLGIAATTNQALAAVELAPEAGNLADWLLVFFEYNYAATRRMSSGGVQPNLNLSMVRTLVVPLPPTFEQKRIGGEVEGHLSVMDAVAGQTSTSTARCTRLRQSILEWAFEGKLVDQDPNDEPASVLLTRIRAERAVAEAATSPRKTGNGHAGSKRAKLPSGGRRGQEAKP